MAKQHLGLAVRALLEPLQAELSAAEQERITQKVESARAELATAQAEVKKLRAMLALYLGQPKTAAANKKSVRPLVERHLASGPLPEKQLLKKVEADFRSKRLPLTGISLVIRALRKDFSVAKGLWSLAGSDHQPPDSPPQGTPEKDGQKSL